MLDHLVVAAASLAEGAAWLEARLGAAPQPGGRHETMGTHNRLLSLGPSCYLEVIAIDPDGRSPSRPRWFALDEPATHERLAAGPALWHWVERTDRLEDVAAASPEPVDLLAFSRGAYRWRMALTRDGRLPGGGRRPTFIQWETATPAAALDDRAVRLLSLGAPDGTARFATPSGEREIPWARRARE